MGITKMTQIIGTGFVRRSLKGRNASKIKNKNKLRHVQSQPNVHPWQTQTYLPS